MDSYKIKAIIFDLGNVLIDFNHRIAGQRISGFTDKTSEEIYNLFFDSDITGAFEEGKISPREFFSRVKGALNLKINYEEFVPVWNEIFFFTEKNIGVYNLASQLKNNYKVALLSNINILHYEYIKNTFPIFDAFHNIITSFEVGARKPKAAIYQETLRILGEPAGSVFYTDDRQELIVGASQLGINSFVFRGVQQLKDDFNSQGVAVN